MAGAMIEGRTIKHSTYFWTPEQEAVLIRMYPDQTISCEEIAAMLGKTPRAVSLRARAMGLPYRDRYYNLDVPHHKRHQMIEDKVTDYYIRRGEEREAQRQRDLEAREAAKAAEDARKGEAVGRAIGKMWK